MRWIATALVCLTVLVARPEDSAAGWMDPTTWQLPSTWTSPVFHPTQWPFQLIPVPEIATDPNTGTTAGVLPVMLFNDQSGQIRNIVAPDIAYNTILGATGTFRYLSYPSSDFQWYAIAGASQDIARRVDLFMSMGRDRTKWWSFEGRLFFERDPTERFFGLGNFSAWGAQSNYTTEQLYARATLGLNFTQKLQLAVVEQPWYMRIQQGALNSLPYIGNEFPNLKGLSGGSELLTRLILSYDNRDSIDIPGLGGLYRVFYGVADRAALSSYSFNEIGAEARHYFRINSRMVLAARAYMEYTPAGSEVPFWAMPRLGGEDSVLADQQTLRGYGAGRFIDNNLTDFNLELRTRILELTIFGTHGTLELAPFVEAGKVFHDVSTDPVNQLHPVGGMGFRGIAEPFVVGYVDVGIGGTGAAIFSGINYPF